MHKDNKFKSIAGWLNSKDAERLVELEATLAKDLVSNLFGYNVVQLGAFYPGHVIKATRSSNKVLASLGSDAPELTSICCDVEAFPFGATTVDLVILPHILEFSRDPAKILREVDRVLIGEGYLVVFGFSHWSFFGLSTVLKRWQDVAPWNCSFISPLKLEDWLRILGLETMEVRHGGFGSLASKSIAAITGNKEKLMKYLFPRRGNVYLLVAKKRVEGVTAIRTSWSSRRKLLKGGLAKPTTSRVKIGNG